MSFNSVLDQLKAFWSRFTTSQRITIGLLATVFVAAFMGLVIWIGQPDFQVLYSNLPPEDASRVVKLLQADKVQFRLENSGTSILVPSD